MSIALLKQDQVKKSHTVCTEKTCMLLAIFQSWLHTIFKEEKLPYNDEHIHLIQHKYIVYPTLDLCMYQFQVVLMLWWYKAERCNTGT